ncbi:MAG TPA: adenylate/guanylate cyclase domain-containing protein [Candidatus Limnocylindria bacterium]|nr:adenylate/guanylate cyclase domain-containing protein [Candidatus Limnocylindria bacterium]
MAEARGAATSPARALAWATLLLLPLLGLALVLARPELDLVWEHHPSHFWLVLLAAAVNVILAFATNEAATRRGDARLILVSYAFLASAGFLGLHALATPGVLLPASNAGFVVATPVGLTIAAGFAALSVSPLAGPRGHVLLRRRVALRRGLVALMVAWAVVSLARLPPLNGPLPPQEAAGPLGVLAAASVPLYAWSAWRYWQLYRRRGNRLALAVAVALVLLAEAMVAVAVSRNWHLSWWEWHVLMTAAFAAIALGARAEYQRTRSLTRAFGGIYLEATAARLDRWHAGAITDLVAAEGRGERAEPLLEQLRREGASEEEIALLGQAAREVGRMGELFRPYLPAQLAERLGREPTLGDLGGQDREVSVLFADLANFTSFSEERPAIEVIGMLNAFWAEVVPVVEEVGGAIEHFAGDGMMVIFNAVGEQPDHAARAARAGLRIVERTDVLSRANPGWPRFRVGINTGRAVVGNVGVEQRRSFAAIGDTSNLGARLLSGGEPGQVVISAGTHRALAQAGVGLAARRIGPVRVKGKREPVEAWILEGLAAAPLAGPLPPPASSPPAGG